MASALTLLRPAALLVGALVATVTLTACEETGVDAVVTNVVDGDTIDVEYDGQEQRVRLLNIDTPETVDPDVEPECLGPEATAFLTSMLPIGTEVHLESDEEATDRYGRYLAGVFLGDTLVNAEIAREGLGVAVLYEPNDRFYDEVATAQEEAKAAGRGLYDATTECTLPAQVAATTASAETVTGAVPADGASLEELEAYGEELAAAAVATLALSDLLNGDRSRFPLVAFADGDLTQMRSSAQDHSDGLQRLADDNRDAVRDEEGRLAEAEAQRQAAEEAAAQQAAEEAAAQRAAEEAAAQRRAAEAAEQRAAEEAQQQAAEEAEREAAERERTQQATERPSSSSSSSSGSSSGSSGTSSSGGYDGYTGCRAYGGNYPPNAVDEKGRPYTKIDCDSRAPIG